MPQIIETTLVVETDDRHPVELIAEATGLSKTKIKSAMTLGACWLTQGKKTKRIRRDTANLKCGDQVTLNYNAAILDLTPPEPELIAHESAYSVWFKPAGLMSSGTRFGDHCAINRWVETHHEPQQTAFIVHRLDRFANGLMVLAHTKRAAAHLSKQFRDRTVKKVYRVIVEGLLETAQTIDSPLDGKASVSIVSPIATDAEQNRTLLEVNIQTGRKHQIRRHLADYGYPVIGDRQYADHQAESLQLTACELVFQHPTSGYRQSYQLDAALLPALNQQE